MIDPRIYTKSYTYDLARNIEAVAVDGSPFATYDDGNKISTISGGAASYDADGNLTSISGTGMPTATFSWTRHDKLWKQTLVGGGSSEYTYNSFGRPLRKELGSSDRYYIYHGDLLIGERYQNTYEVYTWGPAGLISKRSVASGSGASFWYHLGPQGETRYLTDSAGAVTDTYAYTAYGLPVASTGSTPNAYKYGGKYGYYTDGPTGIILAGARWYSPYLMRWLTRDPIGYEGGTNLYEYVGGRPIRFRSRYGCLS